MKNDLTRQPRRSSSRNATMRAWSLFTFLFLTVPAMSGCYEHVIRDTRMGNSSETIYEPNAPGPDEPTVIDRLLYGDEGKKK